MTASWNHFVGNAASLHVKYVFHRDFGTNESTLVERRPEQRHLHDSQNFASEFCLRRLTHESRVQDASVLTDLDIDVKDFDVHLSVVCLPSRGMDPHRVLQALGVH